MRDERKLALARELHDYDHAFLNAEGVAHFAEGFGVTLNPSRHYASPRQPKGLTLDNGAKSAIGMDAADMAEEIARQVTGFQPWQSGRGFRLRSAIAALEAYYGGDDESHAKAS